ncbi:MAG: hypothetical protein R3344_05325 [Acidobacteriota bacterium]|nr:hypothetical protein [Acidobacteriota bacterium]
MRIVLIVIIVLAILAAPAPLATGVDQAPDPVEPDAGEQGTLEEFVPSEEVSADSAISFPVDI